MTTLTLGGKPAQAGFFIFDVTPSTATNQTAWPYLMAFKIFAISSDCLWSFKYSAGVQPNKRCWVLNQLVASESELKTSIASVLRFSGIDADSAIIFNEI